MAVAAFGAVLGAPEAAVGGVDLVDHALVEMPHCENLGAQLRRARLLAVLFQHGEVVSTYLVAHQHVAQFLAETVEQSREQVDGVLAAVHHVPVG